MAMRKNACGPALPRSTLAGRGEEPRLPSGAGSALLSPALPSPVGQPVMGGVHTCFFL